MESSASSSKPSYLSYPCKNTEDDGSKDAEPHLMERRLWLGNLDPKLTEFQLLKLVQKYGTIQQFDFLFHKTGPNIGLPRGYAFVEYNERDPAEKCMKCLSGKKILDRHMVVRWAHQAQVDYQDEQTKLKAKFPALGVQGDEVSKPKISKDRTINAIEAKLMAMEREKDDFTVTGKPSSSTHQSRSYSSGQNRNIPYKPGDSMLKKPYSR